MSYSPPKTASDSEHVSPSLAPDPTELLRDADALLEMMGREPLGVVADLANTLRVSARNAGAWEIETAASNLRRLASGRSPVMLTEAMHALTDAISRTERKRAA